MSVPRVFGRCWPVLLLSVVLVGGLLFTGLGISHPAGTPSDGSDVPTMRSVQGSSHIMIPRNGKQNVFREGENLRLRVSYLGITAGYINANVDTATFRGRPTYKLIVRAKTAGLADLLYSIRDRYVSFMDAQGLFSWGYNMSQRHNGDLRTVSMRYYPHQGKYVKDGEKSGTIPPYTHDVITASYYLRTHDLEVGQYYQFPVQMSEEVYNLLIKVEDLEEVRTRDGKKQAYRLKPSLQDPKNIKKMHQQLKEDKNGVRIWISKDNRKIPLMISIPAKIGSLWGYLESYDQGVAG